MMSLFSGSLVFLHPAILAGLALLPVIWFLLRVTPPAPRLIVFPPARFLYNLNPREKTVSHTPWWILLLRLLIAVLILISLAGPVLNPAQNLPGSGPVRIVMDNGWASAQTWTLQMDAATAIVNSAGRENREIYILATAPEPGKDKPIQQGPLTEGKAEAALSGFRPRPWPADYAAAIAALRELTPEGASMTSFWLSNGLQDEKALPLMRALQNGGGLEFFTPDESRLPLLIHPGEAGTTFNVAIEIPDGVPPNVPVTFETSASDGRTIDVTTLPPRDGKKHKYAVSMDLPAPLRNHAGRVKVAGRAGAGAVLLLDDSARRRTVGIVAPAGEEESAPLVEAGFYLYRAMEPFADVTTGSPSELSANAAIDVLVLPDIGALTPSDLETLEKWVNDGGLLLRFAGPAMAQGDSFLTPVPLLKGGRALDGSMTWEKPVSLAPFPETSPFFGLPVPPDVTVSRQILADPVEGMDKITWASLQDETPLVTAKESGKGWLVMFHTTATPAWSDLALSGLFVKMLERTTALAGKGTGAAGNMAGGALQPLLVLDGFGNGAQPDGSVSPIPADAIGTVRPSSVHPPGLYGNRGVRVALNLGGRIPPLERMSSPPSGVKTNIYERSNERDLMPPILFAAFLLFTLDWIVILLIQTLSFSYKKGFASVIVILLTAALPAQAQDTQESIRHAGDLHFAYVRSGVSSIDYTAQSGLEALREILVQRTSVEPAGVVPLDPERDELAFFPLIYWPVTDEPAPLSDTAARRVQDYLDNGGTVLFDTRGADPSILQPVLAKISIPPLIRIPQDHVLTRTFYLLRRMPSDMWVEETSGPGRDGVSSVIITSENWGADWSGSLADEMSLRFGVNLVMYALTGNYKADQVHLPHIMERLGQ